MFITKCNTYIIKAKQMSAINQDEIDRIQRNLLQKEYRDKNLEKCRERERMSHAKHREDNLEIIKTRQKAYRESNKEKIKEAAKLYRENNKEKIKAAKKLYRQNNPEKSIESSKLYREKQKEKK